MPAPIRVTPKPVSRDAVPPWVIGATSNKPEALLNASAESTSTGCDPSCQVVPEQPRTLDRRRLIDGPLTCLSGAEMTAVERSLKAVLGMYDG